MQARVGAGRPKLELFAAAIAGLLPVVYNPLGAAPHWSARAALLLLCLAVGLPLLLQLVVDGDGAARAGLAFVAAAVAAALLSSRPLLAFLGPYALSGGALFVGSLVALWALGRVQRPEGASLIRAAILTAALVNAVVAVVQLLTDLTPIGIGLAEGRATGLLGSPLWLGMLVSAAPALTLPALQHRPAVGAVLLVPLAAAVQASGGRSVLLVLLGTVGWVAARSGTWRRGILVVAAVACGLVIGTAAARAGGGVDVVSRLETTQASHFQPRLEIWRAAAEAVAERPVFGWGPGRLRAATSDARSLETARLEGPERLFTDAHNLVAEYAATVGLTGLVALSVFGYLAARRARGPFAAFGCAVVVSSLVEPQFVTVLPLAFLAVGCAAPRAPRRARTPTTVAQAVLVVVAVPLAATLLLGDTALHTAQLDYSLASARTAVSMLQPWPQPKETLARVLFFEGKTNRDAATAARAIPAQARAVRADPSDPSAWNTLGDYYLESGQQEAAARSFGEALRRNRWSVRAMAGLAVIAADRCDEEALARLKARITRVTAVPPRVDKLDVTDCAGARNGG